MKKITYIIFLFPLLFLSCSKKDQVKITNTTIPTREVSNNVDTQVVSGQDTVLVKIADHITLQWDRKGNTFIKDANYYTYLKSRNTVQVIAKNIDSSIDLNVEVCSKKTGNLKVGDVAFLYLWETKQFYLFKCLKLQFDGVDANCNIPENLLDYLEKNRHSVEKKVLECIQ